MCGKPELPSTIIIIIPVTSQRHLYIGALSSNAARPPLRPVLTSTQLHVHRSASNSSFPVIHAQAILPLTSSHDFTLMIFYIEKFNGQMGHCLTIFTAFLFKWENTVPQLAFNLNSAPVTAENLAYTNG